MAAHCPAGTVEIGDTQRLPGSPVVSVIILTYRHEQFLAQAVAGVAAQKTDFPFEILVAEDCSPDSTREVALQAQRDYPELVRVIYSAANVGATANARRAIHRCRGQFIASCEGDDFWIDENKLQRQVDALRRHPDVDMSFTSGYRLYPDGSRVPEWNWGPEERIVSAGELFSGFGWPAPAASLLWRAEVCHNLPPLYGEVAFGDQVLLIAGSTRGGAHYDPSRTICYRIAQPSSFTVALLQAPLTQQVAQLKAYLKYLPLTCDYYKFPVRHIAHRLDDYRLSLARAQWRLGQRLRSLTTLASISPRFFAEGAYRRLRRTLKGATRSS